VAAYGRSRLHVYVSSAGSRLVTVLRRLDWGPLIALSPVFASDDTRMRLTKLRGSSKLRSARHEQSYGPIPASVGRASQLPTRTRSSSRQRAASGIQRNELNGYSVRDQSVAARRRRRPIRADVVVLEATAKKDRVCARKPCHVIEGAFAAKPHSEHRSSGALRIKETVR